MTSIITNNGINIIMNRTFNNAPSYTYPNKFSVGSAQSSPAATDTDLTRTIPITGTESVDACDATTSWAAGTDTSGIATNTTTFKEGTASLTLAKSGTTGTVMSMSKTTTSRDFTSKDFWMWVYITSLSDLVTSGTALTVRFGSDNTNYYSYDVAIGSLAVGWNYIVFSSSTATSTTGAPAIAACDYTEVRFNTPLAATTIAAGRIFVDDMKVASSDDYVKTIDSATVDETGRSATLQATLLATEANGYNITGFGFKNTDATAKLFSEAKITVVSKSSTEELVGTQKIRFRRTVGG